MEENKAKHSSARRNDVLIQVVSTFLAFAVAVSVALVMTSILFPAGSFISFVDGDSMLPTLTDGQILFMDPSGPQRGDLVISRMPKSTGEDTLIVKRIIAMPGDTLTINAEGVFVNSKRIEEPYLTEEAAAATYISSHYNYMILGPDQYYLLGDNRANSWDSRLFGAVTQSDLQHKQSVAPTQHTYLMAFLLVVIVVLCYGLYCLMDNCVTKLLRKFLLVQRPIRELPEDHEKQS